MFPDKDPEAPKADAQLAMEMAKRLLHRAWGELQKRVDNNPAGTSSGGTGDRKRNLEMAIDMLDCVCEGR